MTEHSTTANNKTENREADEILKFIRRGFYEYLYGLKLVRDRKYYTDYGYESMEEFAEAECDLGRRQLFYYLQIADKFLQTAWDNNVHISALLSLGVSKLKLLCLLDNSVISELKKYGELRYGAKAYTIKELKEMTVDALKSLIGLVEKAIKEISYVFKKVYKRVENWLSHIVDNVHNCPDFIEYDVDLIEKSIRQIEKIFEKYNPKPVTI